MNWEMIEYAEKPGMYQCVLEFIPGIELSIISGPEAMASDEAPYEITVFRNGRMANMAGITDGKDVVRGYMTKDDVDLVIKKMYAITGKVPRQL